MTPTVVLSIAGSDPCGGAGIQADLRTFAALGVHGTTAITALTVQNTEEVRSVSIVDADVVGAQIDAITGDVTVAATNTGMLGSVASLEMVADRHRKLGPLVIDPVLRASTGKTLSPDGMVGAYRRVLIPLAAVVCPNLVEASELCDRVVDDVAAMYQAGRALLDLGAGAAVITGGHLAGDDVIDVFVSATEQAEFRRARVGTTNDHGTGCTYSSAVAAYLARGESLIRAAEQAGRFVERALLGAQGWSLGHGRGPLDQMGWPEQSG